MPEPRSLIIDTNEDFCDVLFCNFLCTVGLANVDRRELVTVDRMCTFEVVFHRLLVLVVDHTPLISERVHEVLGAPLRK